MRPPEAPSHSRAATPRANTQHSGPLSSTRSLRPPSAGRPGPGAERVFMAGLRPARRQGHPCPAQGTAAPACGHPSAPGDQAGAF